MAEALRIPIDTDGVGPVCPHCGKDVGEVVDHRGVSPRSDFSQVLHLLACPHCRKVLGASVNAELA